MDKAVIPAAGLGTRLLPATKEQPKEMLPVYARYISGEICLKPLLQLIFEQLYDVGFREFCIVIGRGKRVIEDHFTQEYSHTKYLRNRNRASGEDLDAFYRRLDDSVISWVTQPEPRGFGDAVLRARRPVNDSPFMVHAGDAYVLSHGNIHLKRLARAFDGSKASAALLVHEVVNPKQKGVAEVKAIIGSSSFEVLSVEEKPESPKTNIIIEPIYLFQPHFLEALRRVKPDKRGEIQVTDAIQLMINEGRKVYAATLLEEEIRLDVGDPYSYWDALSASYNFSKR